jgi:uncharacterized protein YndB with AHSA1/START domain
MCHSHSFKSPLFELQSNQLTGNRGKYTKYRKGDNVVSSESDTGRLLMKSCVVHAPRKNIWAAFTTSDGAETFFAPEAHIELRLNGRYELYFDTGAEPGSRGSEGCHVLSFIPLEMLSFTWNAPPAFPEIRGKHTFVVVEFDEIEPCKTAVTLTHAGWGSGGQWDDVYAYFEQAWDIVLHNLCINLSVCSCSCDES